MRSTSACSTASFLPRSCAGKWLPREAVARTPKDILALEKLAINRAHEAGGSRDALFQGIEIDAIAHTSPAVKEVNRYIKEHGLREALRAFQTGDLL